MTDLKIQINPDIFNPSNFIKSRKKAPRTSAAAKTIRPIPLSQLKKRIYNQLRSSDVRSSDVRSSDASKSPAPEVSEFENSFTSSLDYYKSLEQDNAKKRAPVANHNQTIRNNEPVYGNLKGGNKPTYRTWLAKTQSHRDYQPVQPVQPQIVSTVAPQQLPPQQIVSTVVSPPQQPPQQIVSTVVSPPQQLPPQQIVSTVVSPPQQPPSTVAPQQPPSTVAPHQPPVVKPGGKIIRKKKTLRKFKLGKQDDERVSVYVPDRKTRKSWNDEFVKIKTVPISSMRKELIDKKLVKVGAGAPNDIVRAIYENMKTIGDVENTSKDVLVHNFFSDTATNS